MANNTCPICHDPIGAQSIKVNGVGEKKSIEYCFDCGWLVVTELRKRTPASNKAMSKAVYYHFSLWNNIPSLDEIRDFINANFREEISLETAVKILKLSNLT